MKCVTERQYIRAWFDQKAFGNRLSRGILGRNLSVAFAFTARAAIILIANRVKRQLIKSRWADLRGGGYNALEDVAVRHKTGARVSRAVV
jgi:hypothetical protein